MPKKKQFHVYILASERNGTLYIGVTSKRVLCRRPLDSRLRGNDIGISRMTYIQNDNGQPP